jgi:RHH-type proline utilization regulon transcriptional repressor/proline dehydrogenase/delta 1-pyrroline-5-carboxylate dehydrogenase
MHLVRYKARDLDRLIDQINHCGYGLTLGIHSRNEGTAAHIESRARVGNTYINRNQVGATVGVQPFGGQGLSGTGPKAGGPHYLLRFTQLATAATPKAEEE